MVSVPVWLLREQHGDRVFLMNGQDGKVVGDVPVDSDARREFLMRWGGAGAVVSVLAAVATWLGTGGPDYVPGPFSPTPDPAVMAGVTLCGLALLFAATLWLVDSRRMERRGPVPATDYPSRRGRNIRIGCRKGCGDFLSKDDAMEKAVARFAEEEAL